MAQEALYRKIAFQAGSTMQKRWSEEVYDYDDKKIMHSDLLALDLEEGRWFSCRYCQNSKDANGRYLCRTPFSKEEMTSVRAGHFEKRSHKDRKQEAAKSGQSPSPSLQSIFQKKDAGAPGEAVAAPSAVATAAPAAAAAACAASFPDGSQDAPPPKKVLPCSGIVWSSEDKDPQWQNLCKTYLHFIDGAPSASRKFTMEKVDGKFVQKAVECNGIGLPGWQTGVKCCKACHLVRTDPNHGAKNSMLLMEKLSHSVTILGQQKLTKSDVAYLQHSVLERPASSGNQALASLKEVVKVRISLETAEKLPLLLRGTAGEKLFELVVKVYSNGDGQEMEKSVVHHMTMNFLQKLAGNPTPTLTTKLFAFARVLRHLHKPSYEFFRSNALVGPHVDTIQKFEAKTPRAVDELIVCRTAEGGPTCFRI